MNIFIAILIFNIIILMLYVSFRTSSIKISIKDYTYNLKDKIVKKEKEKNKDNNEFKNKEKERSKENKGYQINIKIYLFDILPILNIKLTKDKIEKLDKKLLENRKLRVILTKQINHIIKNKDDIDIKIGEEIKYLYKLYNENKFIIELEKLNLSVYIGTINAMLTIYLIPLLSTILALILRNTSKTDIKKNKEKEKNKNKENKKEKIESINLDKDNIKYEVNPIFEQKNILKIKCDTVFKIKIYDIFIIFSKLQKHYNYLTIKNKSNKINKTDSKNISDNYSRENIQKNKKEKIKI